MSSFHGVPGVVSTCRSITFLWQDQTFVHGQASVYVMKCAGMQACFAVTACVHSVCFEVDLTLEVQIMHEGHAPSNHLSICETMHQRLHQKQVSPASSRFCPPGAMTGGAPKTCSPLEPLHQTQLGLSRTAEGCLLQWHQPAATAIVTTWPQAP